MLCRQHGRVLVLLMYTGGMAGIAPTGNGKLVVLFILNIGKNRPVDFQIQYLQVEKQARYVSQA